ncbi:hypothetical protein MAR_019711, partial [Mya arenaria]
MSAYDQFEKLFCGEWKFDKAENAEEFCNNAKMSPEDKQMLMNISPDILFQRKGDSFLQTYRLAPGVKPSFTNGVFVQEIYSQLPGKCDLVVDGKMEGDYLVTMTAEETQMFKTVHPDMLYQRKGDSLVQTYRFGPGAEMSVTIKFGEEYVSKDTTEPPRWHNKVKPSFTNGVFVQEIYSQLPGKCDLVVDGKMEGDYLVV